MKEIKSSFYPVGDLSNKSNYKPYCRIERDGTIYERILLNIPDVQLREEIVCKHFLKNQVMLFEKERVMFNVISRDDPWDFKIKTNSNEIFNVEITSIADDRILFEKMKREERLQLNSLGESIPFHELVKLNKLFPNSKIEKEINLYLNSNIDKNDLVKNPYKLDSPHIFISNRDNKKTPLEELVKESIEKKENKKHNEKDNTFLIIDNRTLTYEYSDLHAAQYSLRVYLKSTSFKEIWFYTGYYTDLNGNNAEFSLAPLKLSENKLKVLEVVSHTNPPDENGIIFLK